MIGLGLNRRQERPKVGKGMADHFLEKGVGMW